MIRRDGVWRSTFGKSRTNRPISPDMWTMGLTGDVSSMLTRTVSPSLTAFIAVISAPAANAPGVAALMMNSSTKRCIVRIFISPPVARGHKDRPVPAIHGHVALAAIGGEASGAMIRVLGCIEVFRVAAVAFGGQPEAIELPNSSYLVAGIAVHHGVRADQGKAILMLIDVMNRDLPPIGVMAELTFGSVLASMKVGVAVLTLVGRIGKFEIGMAVTACHSGVAPTKGKASLPVIKLDLSLNYLPIRGCVAGNTRHVEFAVRTLRTCERPC